ncbi:MAG: DNA repair protein RecO [Clostridiales bacterium]|jgi:DNA repair protein RecO (recombination protein O)|nr:DNA repair protein RecO [Clostridiales bacterium]
MAIIKDFGVVLREYEAGETDKKLVLLTRAHGKMTVFARGARRTGSKLATGLFSYNEFVIFEGTGFYSLNAAQPVHVFDGIAEDYDKFCFACCFLEMVDKMVLTGMDSAEILNVLLYALAELTRARHAPATVFAVFAVKLLQTEGFAPLIGSAEGNAIVQTGESALTLSALAARSLTYILEANAKEMFAFRASPDVTEQLYRAARLFVAENLDARLKSLEMIGDLCL